MGDDPLFSRLSPRAALALILTFGFCVRVATFQSPILDHHAWRQADTAAISRAFVNERYNILYPQVDWRGAADTGYVETGLELHAFLVATIAKLSGFKPEIGRLLSSIFFLLSCRLVWAFTRRRYGAGPGLLAAYLYAFGFPLMLFMERAFMNEALLVCLSLASLVSAQRYLDDAPDAAGRRDFRARGLALAWLFLSTALAGAVKFPYLIVLAPVCGLFIERYGRGALTRPEPWAVSVFAIGMAALWYQHAHLLGQQSGLSFGTFDKTFRADLVLSERFYRMVGQRIFRDILGPIGLLGMVSGAAYAWRHRRWCEGLGLLAFLAYVFLVAQGNLSHDYYQLAMMPVAATLVAIGLLDIIDHAPPLRRAYATSVTTLLILVALATTIRSASFHSWYTVPRDEQSVCELVPKLFLLRPTASSSSARAIRGSCSASIARAGYWTTSPPARPSCKRPGNRVRASRSSTPQPPARCCRSCRIMRPRLTCPDRSACSSARRVRRQSAARVAPTPAVRGGIVRADRTHSARGCPRRPR